jgi:hypothetical protein
VAEQGEQLGIGPSLWRDAARLIQSQLGLDSKNFGPRIESRTHRSSYRVQHAPAFELADFELASETQGMGCLLAGEIPFAPRWSLQMFP